MGDEADRDYALVDVELGYEAAERFYGVVAPAWNDDGRLAEILREEANDQRDWFGTDRDKALLLTVADRLDALNYEFSEALKSLRDQELMAVQIADLRAQVENRDVVAAAFDGEEERLRGALRAERTRTETLRAALAPFAITTSDVGRWHLRCDGSGSTGYRCGINRDGRAIYGFDAWCKWCAARKALGVSLDVNLMPEEFEELRTALAASVEETHATSGSVVDSGGD